MSLSDLGYLPVRIGGDIGYSLLSIAFYLGVGFSPLPLIPHWDFGWLLEKVGQAAIYSLGALVRLNPEPKPDDSNLFQSLVIVEGILGPLQIALLALAIRRKVMP